MNQKPLKFSIKPPSTEHFLVLSKLQIPATCLGPAYIYRTKGLIVRIPENAIVTWEQLGGLVAVELKLQGVENMHPTRASSILCLPPQSSRMIGI